MVDPSADPQPALIRRVKTQTVDPIGIPVPADERPDAQLFQPGKGQIQASWLFRWPSNYTGVVDGGTGTFAHAKGQVTGTTLRNGQFRITATLR